MQLSNAAGERIAEIGFLDEGERLPVPRITPELTRGSGFLPFSNLLPLVDMLRNERLVFVTLEDGPPSSMRIHT